MVGAPATTAAPAVDGFVFKKKVPAVGTKVIETESKTTNLTLDITPKPKAKAVKVVRSERAAIEKTVEILAVSADAITKVKVTYKTHSKVETKDAKESATTSPVTGKTYVVEAKDGAITVLTDKGAVAPADEAKAVQDDFKKLGKPNDLAKSLPDTPLKVGDRVDALGQAFQARMAKDDDGNTKTTVESTSVTLARVNEKNGSKTGVFDLAFDHQRRTVHCGRLLGGEPVLEHRTHLQHDLLLRRLGLERQLLFGELRAGFRDHRRLHPWRFGAQQRRAGHRHLRRCGEPAELDDGGARGRLQPGLPDLGRHRRRGHVRPLRRGTDHDNL